MNGSRKLLNCAARTRKMSTTARPKAGRNLLPSVRSCRDFTGVIDNVALGQNLARFVLKKLERRIERPSRYAANRDRVELLHPIERTRHGLVLDLRDRAQWNQLAIRAADVNVLQLLRIQALRSA